jgi:hypothetical protein
MRVAVLGCALLIGCGLAIGCAPFIGCAPGFTVVQRADPSPFRRDSSFAVAPPLWEHDADENDKSAFDKELAATLMRSRGLRMTTQGQFLVRPTVQWMEPGYLHAIKNAPAQVKVRVDILDASGNPVDTIEVAGHGEAVEPFNAVPRATVGERLKLAAAEVAGHINHYLRTRIK